MKTRNAPQPDPGATPGAPARAYRWLLLVHVLPSTPSNLRVRTWRRLQRLGAIAVKQSVYVLPDSLAAREDFEWLKTEIAAAGGEATVFAADNVDAWADEALVEEFRRSRQEAYGELSREIDVAFTRAARKASRRRRGPAPGKLLNSFRQRLTDLERIDFFGSPGRDRIVTLLAQVERRISPPSPRATDRESSGGTDRKTYQARVWVTRPRPGVDRMASAWLIRRFIDPEATFDFVADGKAAPRDAVPFDMFGVEFSHHGAHCTFETLCARFACHEPALSRLGAIVHDLDFKDDRFGAAEAQTLGPIIEGLQLSTDSDAALLERGVALFEALYRSFSRSSRPHPAKPAHRPTRGRRRSNPRSR